MPQLQPISHHMDHQTPQIEDFSLTDEQTESIIPWILILSWPLFLKTKSWIFKIREFYILKVRISCLSWKYGNLCHLQAQHLARGGSYHLLYMGHELSRVDMVPTLTASFTCYLIKHWIWSSWYSTKTTDLALMQTWTYTCGFPFQSFTVSQRSDSSTQVFLAYAFWCLVQCLAYQKNLIPISQLMDRCTGEWKLIVANEQKDVYPYLSSYHYHYHQRASQHDKCPLWLCPIRYNLPDETILSGPETPHLGNKCTISS